MRLAILALLPLLCACEGEAEKAVRAMMRDPDATQFRSVIRCPADRDLWHGEFNGKNLYGAYTGFESFYYEPGVGVTRLSDPGAGALIDRCYGNASTQALPESMITATDDADPVPPVPAAKSIA